MRGNQRVQFFFLYKGWFEISKCVQEFTKRIQKMHAYSASWRNFISPNVYRRPS